ncbi:MAG: energy-coupling factor transporter transmembrane component T [Methanobacterium sp.]|nr:energy-coupling factor transporter transmembrane component T [Methanobacterium sp.]
MRLTKLHPAIYIIYYMILIIFAFLINDPFYLISFLICLIILIILQGISREFKNMIKFFIPISLLIIIINPLVSHIGITKLFIIGNYYITMESLMYGILLSISLLIVLTIFLCYNNTVSYQEMLYIFSKKFLNISMIIIMAMRFIPLLHYRWKEVNKLYKFNNIRGNGNYKESKIEQIKNTAHVLSVVISWSLEESMVAAKSMKARGYGITNRTNYLYFKFKRIDFYILVIIISCFLISLTGIFYGYGRIEIYPQVLVSYENLINIFYLSFLILLLPIIYIEIKEKLLWI